MSDIKFTPYQPKSDSEEVLMHGGLPLAGQQLVFEVSKDTQPKVVIEVGVASGLGARSILMATRCGHIHYGIDISESFYHDERFRTGHVARGLPGFNLVISNTYNCPESIYHKAQLLFIDADHRHPFPTIDLWNLLSAGLLEFPLTLILDDVLLPLKFIESGFSYRGATILYNSLLKHGAIEHRYSKKAALNTKALMINSSEDLNHAILDSLCVSWEIPSLESCTFRNYDWAAHDQPLDILFQ